MKMPDDLAERVAQTIAVTLTGGAMVASYAHVLDTVRDTGQDGGTAYLIAALPEATVALALLRLRLGGRSAWSWGALTLGIAGTVVGNLAQAAPGGVGFVVALAPALFSVACLGMVHLGDTTPDMPSAPAGQLVQQGPKVPRDVVAATLDAATGATPDTRDSVSVPPVTPRPAKSAPAAGGAPADRDARLAWVTEHVQRDPDVTLPQLAKLAGGGVSKSTLARDLREVRRPRKVAS